jgi:hypothetical protein
MEKNKTAKYLKYAIGEIILAVIGILIALQINNWNENRIKCNKETTIITNIHKEFKENKKQLEKVVKTHQIVKIGHSIPPLAGQSEPPLL